MNSIVKIPEPKQAPLVTTFDARDLIQDGNQICIALDDQRYFLRITRAGKLILTK